MRPATRLPLLRALYFVAIIAVLCVGLAAHAAPTEQPAATHHIFLPLVAQGGASSPPGGPTSQELIARALQSGAIDRQTALRYHLLADFNDPRLPAAYRGAASPGNGQAYELALRALDRLAPETLSLVREFSVPPSVEGSGEEGQGAATRTFAQAANAHRWDTTCKTSPNIKVWYHPANEGDAETARRICEVMDNAVWIWLTRLMGHTPLPDDTTPHTGGDARFDIYLVDAASSVLSARGIDSSMEARCQDTPTYMLVNRAGFTRSQLAGLLMQAILRGYDADLCGEYAWLYLATTHWASDYVFPDDNEEHADIPAYLDAAATPLDDSSRSDELMLPTPGVPEFENGALLWPYFLHHILNKPELIAQIWERSDEPDSLQMIDSVLSGGWKQQWPAFARAAWNRDSENEYMVLDGLQPGLKPLHDEPIVLDGAPAKSIALDGAVKYLAVHSFRFTFPDANVRSLMVVNRYREADLKTARVQALVKIDGAWRVEDWTTSALHPFCRDLKAERVEELVLLVSNHEFVDRSHTLRGEDGPRLNVSNLACRGWKVAVSVTSSVTSPVTELTETTTAEATFERFRTPGVFGFAEEYRTTGGNASWQQRGHLGECVGSGSGSYALADSGGSGQESYGRLSLNQYGLAIVQGSVVFDGPRQYAGVGNTRAARAASVTYVCPEGAESRMYPLTAMWLVTDHEVRTQVAGDDGTRIEGTHTISDTDIGDTTTTNTWRWVMTALPPE